MMNLLKIYALLRSPIFWVFIILVWIGISLPESWQEGWAEITVGIIGTMIAIAFCRLFNIAIGWGLLFCGAVAFALHPILGSIILAIAIILLVAMFSNSSTNNTTTPVKNIDKKFKTPKDLQDEEIEYRKKQKPRKVKNPFTEAVQIDEPIDVEPFIKIRDAINSINFNSITPSNLYFKLTEIEDKVDMRIFRTSETTIDTLKEMKDKLNAADLDNKTAISLQELFGATEEDAKDYEDKYMKKLQIMMK